MKCREEKMRRKDLREKAFEISGLGAANIHLEL